MGYRHTQTATLMLLISVLGLAGGIWIGVGQPFDTVGNVIIELVSLLLVVVGLVAARLTVSIDGRSVSTWFGWGWPRRTIALVDIVSAERVRNSWWHGWGLRMVRGGWMYNNAGYDAVELRLASGKVFRIGTDEPDVLLGAIDAARLAA
jgi:hypothetical protein